MHKMNNISKILIFTGIFLIILGLIFPLIKKIPLGKLPGDISISGKNFQIFFPVSTSILISIILTVVLNLLFRK